MEVSALSTRRLGSVLAAVCLFAPTVRAEDGGGLVGWVESTRGVPVAGAVISVFGEGIRGGSLITRADSDGQFMLPSLPAGSYTLRAIGTGHQPSAAERVTVLPNRDSLFTLSLTPLGQKPHRDADASAGEERKSADDPGLREWRWLMRHKRRSVLETESNGAAPTEVAAATTLTPPTPRYDAVGPVAGHVEVVALSHNNGGPSLDEGAPPAGLGTLKLQGQLADGIHWSLGGLLAENEARSWRMAAEFVLEPGGGHEVQAGAGYGAGYTAAPLASDDHSAFDRSVGAFFVRDRWRVGERLTTSFGARYTYIGFLSNPHYADAVVQIELRGDPHTLVHASLASRTLAPGGDLLTLSTASASPAISWARLDEGLRPSRTRRYELGVDRSFRGGHVGAFAFGEDTRDQLWTTFDGTGSLSVHNVGSAGASGLGVKLGTHFGSVVSGSVTYTFGRGSRPVFLGSPSHVLGFEDAAFHDVVARLETFINWTDTRVAALYRLNAMSEDGEAPAVAWTGPATTTRFDVQVTQGLPFLQPLTRADWDLLVAVSNLFYEASEGGFLDELAVQQPPTRVVGGISVRF
jgi:Carboxypeptidase regulatory-like domain/TonB dependent receptor-like, beta-barrel